MLVDMHTHSSNSSDAQDSVTEMCESAIKKGISCIAVTDHCDAAFFEKENLGLSIKQSYSDILRARDAFAGRIELLRGIEIGYAKKELAIAERMVGEYQFDFILGSLHNIDGVSDFAFLDYSKFDTEDLLRRYYSEMYDMACWGKFDSLAHITYPLRYICGMHGIKINIGDYADRISAIYRELVRQNKALEINTSGLRQQFGTTMPDLWGLELYKKAGGEMITVGSDAHTAKDVGTGIMEGIALAKQAGFSDVYLFRDRKPVAQKI